jgi:LysM repeat protein
VEKRTTNTTDLNALATAVIRGDYGNGADRQARLGDNYQAVMNIVNSRLSGSTYPGSTTVTRTYVVRSGDTVSAIAERTGLKPASAWRVPSGNINRIYVGQVITYYGSSATSTPSTTYHGSSTHVVSAGESLWKIYGTGWYAAAQRNGIRPPYTIYPGQRLR